MHDAQEQMVQMIQREVQRVDRQRAPPYGSQRCRRELDLEDVGDEKYDSGLAGGGDVVCVVQSCLELSEHRMPQLTWLGDARDKRTIGQVWVAASGGRCVFAMVTDTDVAGKSVSAQLRDAIGA